MLRQEWIAIAHISVILIFSSVTESPLGFSLHSPCCPTQCSRFSLTDAWRPSKLCVGCIGAFSGLPPWLDQTAYYLNVYCFYSLLFTTKNTLVQPHIFTPSQHSLLWMPLETGNAVKVLCILGSLLPSLASSALCLSHQTLIKLD